MPGYSLESSNTLDVIFLIGFLMAALKKKKVFGACSFSEKCRLIPAKSTKSMRLI